MALGDLCVLLRRRRPVLPPVAIPDRTERPFGITGEVFMGIRLNGPAQDPLTPTLSPRGEGVWLRRIFGRPLSPWGEGQGEGVLCRTEPDLRSAATAQRTASRDASN
jgi:hypothetical protein